MKKYWLVGAVLCGLLSFSFLNYSASACIGPDGKPVEGTDGAVTNCGSVEEGEVSNPDYWEVDPETLDFGMLSEVGRSYTASFEINNSTEGDLEFTVAANKYDGDDIADENKLASGWLAFVGGVTYYKVPALSKKTVNVRVIVPADAKAGTQYALIKITGSDEKVQYVNVRMTVGGEDAKFGGAISSSFISPFGLSDKVSAKATVKNSGNAGFEAKYVLRGKSAFGNADWKVLDEDAAEVAPSKEVTFESSDTDEALGYGIFQVEQKITYVNDKGEMVEAGNSRTVINMPMWLLIVIGVVILLIIGLIVFLAVRSKKKEEEEQEAEEAEKAKKSKKNTQVDIEIDEDK